MMKLKLLLIAVLIGVQTQANHDVLPLNNFNFNTAIVYVCDMSGRIIMASAVDKSHPQIDISELNNGAYLLICKDVFGDVLTRDRFVKVKR